MNHELAWAAGIFDGEGCAQFAWSEKRQFGVPRLSVSQRDSEIPERFMKAVDCGRVYRSNRRKNCPMHYWICSRQSDILKVVDLLWPWLSTPKRVQVKGVLALYEEQRELTALKRHQPRKRKTHCKRNHPMTGDNVRMYRGYKVCRACHRMTKKERREFDMSVNTLKPASKKRRKKSSK